MSTKNEIVNLAASHLAYASVITDVETDDSATAQVMNRFFEPARKSFLRGFEWPFAFKIASLGEAETDPFDTWSYGYTYPSDAVDIRWINSVAEKPAYHDDMNLYLIHHTPEPGAGGSGVREIYCNISPAYAGYTVDVTNVARFTEDAAIAFSYLLALYCAPRVTAGDNSAFTKQISEQYMFHLGVAKANAANEDGSKTPPDSEFIRARS